MQKFNIIRSCNADLQLQQVVMVMASFFRM